MSVLTAVIVCLACFGGLLFGIPALIRSEASGYLAESVRDHNLFVTAEILRLAQSDDTRPLVVIIGASVTRSSFGTTQDIADAIRSETDQDVEVVNLCTGRQDILDHMLLLDLLPRDRDLHVVLGLGASRLTTTREDLAETVQRQQFGLNAPILNEEAARLGLAPASRTGIYLIDHTHFYLPRLGSLVRNLVSGPVQQDELQYVDDVRSEKDFRQKAEYVMTRFEDGDENLEMNLGLLGRLADRLEARGNARLSLVEQAINPRFVRDYLTPERQQAHLDRMAAWTAARDIPHWTLATDAGLGEADFVDWGHIGSADAQVRMRALLARRLGEVWHDRQD